MTLKEFKVEDRKILRKAKKVIEFNSSKKPATDRAKVKQVKKLLRKLKMARNDSNRAEIINLLN